MHLRSLPSLPLLLLAAFVAVGLAGPSGLAAQAILNTERFQLEDVEGFHLGADLSVSAQGGNTELVDVSASGIAGVLGTRHWTRVIFGGRYLSDEERSILDQHYIQLRYSYILRRGLRTFHFVQAQRNESLRLRSRWLVGTGIRRDFVRGERLRISAGTGVMGEWERLDPDRVEPGEDTRRDGVRMANLAVASWELPGGARLLDILYLQPALDDLSDARILNELALAVPLADGIRTTLTFEWRRDTRPPAGLDRDDLSLRFGIGFDIP